MGVLFFVLFFLFFLWAFMINLRVSSFVPFRSFIPLGSLNILLCTSRLNSLRLFNS